MLKIISSACLVVVIGLIALASVWAQQAWLAPSIAAAAFTQVFLPKLPGAKPYGIVTGQVIGAMSGFAGVYAAHAAHADKFMSNHQLGYDRVLAIVIAVAITALVQELAGSRSPAGGTTAIVVALAVETADWSGAGRLAVGIALVAILGEAARQIMLRVDKTSPAAEQGS